VRWKLFCDSFFLGSQLAHPIDDLVKHIFVDGFIGLVPSRVYSVWEFHDPHEQTMEYLLEVRPVILVEAVGDNKRMFMIRIIIQIIVS
jgi:hypothetical protein